MQKKVHSYTDKDGNRVTETSYGCGLGTFVFVYVYLLVLFLGVPLLKAWLDANG